MYLLTLSILPSLIYRPLYHFLRQLCLYVSVDNYSRVKHISHLTQPIFLFNNPHENIQPFAIFMKMKQIPGYSLQETKLFRSHFHSTELSYFHHFPILTFFVFSSAHFLLFVLFGTKKKKKFSFHHAKLSFQILVSSFFFILNAFELCFFKFEFFFCVQN